MNKIKQRLSKNSAISPKKIIGRDELQQLIDNKIVIEKVINVKVSRDVYYQYDSDIVTFDQSKCTFFENDKENITKELYQVVNELDEDDFVYKWADEPELIIKNDKTGHLSRERDIDEFFNCLIENFHFRKAWKNLNETSAKEYVIVTILTENLNHKDYDEFIEKKRVLVRADYLDCLGYEKSNCVNYEEYLRFIEINEAAKTKNISK